MAVLLVSLRACSRESPAPAPAPVPPAPVSAPTSAPPPAPTKGVEVPPFDPADYCTHARLPQDVLCKCLDKAFESEAYCEVERVGAGFGIFTRNGNDYMVVHETSEGMLLIGFLQDAGYEVFHIKGTHTLELGGKPVLWIDANRDWSQQEGDPVTVFLCPAREPGSTKGMPHCMTIPVDAVTQEIQSGTHEPIGPAVRSRFSISFTPRSEVVVRSIGKLRHPELKKLLGKHKLE